MWPFRKIKPEEKYLRTGVSTAVELKDKNVIDLVTVTFNNLTVLRHQYRLLKKNFKDQFCYTIADNSTDPEKRKAIKEFCIQNEIIYLDLPQNPFSNIDPSKSHGLALNWVYYNFIKPRNAAYFGFIDHDIFPIKETQILHYLDSENMYGRKQFREEKWYLWPGLCFYKSSFVSKIQLNFMPFPGLDTGGANWEKIYSKISESKIVTLKEEVFLLRQGNIHQSDRYEIIGDWLHTVNASYWMKVEDKEDVIENLLRNH